MEEKWISIPQRFMVYHNVEPDIVDPYTVVYPDGVVFTFELQQPHKARYLCCFKNFSKDDADEPIELVPESVMESIITQEI